jgi:hypothetical protein
MAVFFLIGQCHERAQSISQLGNLLNGVAGARQRAGATTPELTSTADHADYGVSAGALATNDETAFGSRHDRPTLRDHTQLLPPKHHAR